MDFQSASHGVSFTGMEQFKDAIHMNVFQKLMDEIRNTTDIQNAVKQGWVGTSADNFIANVETGANKMAEELKNVQEMLDTELEGIQSQIGDMDDTLVERES